MNIIWSKDASDALTDIVLFIRDRSGKKIAQEIYSRIKKKVESVADFPETGRVVPELSTIGITEVHELIEPPWRIFYRIYHQEVRILSVIDGRRNIEDILYRKVIDGKLH